MRLKNRCSAFWLFTHNNQPYPIYQNRCSRFGEVIEVCFWAASRWCCCRPGAGSRSVEGRGSMSQLGERCQAKKPLPGGVPVATDRPGGSCRISPGGLGRTRASGWVGSFCGAMRRRPVAEKTAPGTPPAGCALGPARGPCLPSAQAGRPPRAACLPCRHRQAR